MKLALLSNFTVEVLAGMLRTCHEVWTPSGFGAWMQTALSNPGELRRFAPDAIFLLLDRRGGDVSASDLSKAFECLLSDFPSAKVFCPDLGRIANAAGPGFYDDRMAKFASLPFSMKGLRAIETEIERLLVATSVPKVIAVDFDGTLWAGVVGEDGATGVHPFSSFQSRLKAAKDSGMLLVGVSRNNAEDVESVWDVPGMVLSQDDFALISLGWNGKADALESIAKKLNLGLDSFVFIDDNPVERAEVSAALHSVAVPDYPCDPMAFAPDGAVTAEDLARTTMYQAEARREELRDRARALDDYLRELQIVTDVHEALPNEFERIAQLSQKSNQFNVCTNRYSVDDISRIASDDTKLMLVAKSSDRFGDYGLIAVEIAAIDGETAQVTDFVMSCRAMNRGIEGAVEAEMEKRLAARGVKRLDATFVPTAKNAPAADIFAKLGFDKTSENSFSKTL